MIEIFEIKKKERSVIKCREMAKLVDIWHGDSPTELKRRQMPLDIDENLTVKKKHRKLYFPGEKNGKERSRFLFFFFRTEREKFKPNYFLLYN